MNGTQLDVSLKDGNLLGGECGVQLWALGSGAEAAALGPAPGALSEGGAALRPLTWQPRLPVRPFVPSTLKCVK